MNLVYKLEIYMTSNLYGLHIYLRYVPFILLMYYLCSLFNVCLYSRIIYPYTLKSLTLKIQQYCFLLLFRWFIWYSDRISTLFTWKSITYTLHISYISESCLIFFQFSINPKFLHFCINDKFHLEKKYQFSFCKLCHAFREATRSDTWHSPARASKLYFTF